MDFSAVTKPVERLLATAQNGLEVLRYGGLETGAVPSPFQIIQSVPMFKLRRYFPPDARPGAENPGPPVLMVHPMMMAADMWDVTRNDGAVGILHRAGVDPWVIDFGSPDEVEGGMQRNLADHVVALSEAIDTVKKVTGRDVHLAGYSQGGMFAYQAAAYRRSKDLASIIAFGAPVDTLAALPMNLPAGVAAGAADFMADHVFSRIDIPGWLARAGFQMLDPIKTAQSRLDFLRQLHDREALLPREQQRRFLASEGWIAWSGPAISELLKQFIAHNRMMTGGFSIHGDLVTLSDIDCPVLVVVGEVDDIGQPAAVRGIKRAAPQADVYEYLIRAGHFGLVVGSKASNQTWPTVAQWVKWLDNGQEMPEGVAPMDLPSVDHPESGVSFTTRVTHGATAATEMAFGVARSAADAVVAANKSARTLVIETVRTLPRLARLGQVNDHTRISLGRIMSEQARDHPNGEALLFDGRVHTYEAVDRRINNVVRGLIDVGVRQGAHVGVLMETRPSALVAIAALSRLGAVAVLIPPDVDLAEAARLGGVSEIIADPSHLEAARRLETRVLVLGGGPPDVRGGGPPDVRGGGPPDVRGGGPPDVRGGGPPDVRGGEIRDLHLPEHADVVDMEQIDPGVVELPGWYRPNPGLARDLAFVAFATVADELVARQITNFRWALSAFGTASAANLGRGDTVYCLTPLHHQSGLLVSLGGAVVGGSRIALSRGLQPDRFLQEIRQYGVTVVSYTWAMLREVIDDPSFSLVGSHPVRLFIGSGMPAGLWKRVVEIFEPAQVVEFFATTDGQAVLANVSGAKIGSKGRPLPGGGHVELAAYDAEDDLILEDEQGFVRRAEPNEVGVLLAHPRGPVDPTASVKRGVFAPADTWVSTEFLFRRDEDGDYWQVDNRGAVIHTERGPVYGTPISDVVGRLEAVDLAVTYGVDVGGQQVAVTALALRPGGSIATADLTDALSDLPVGSPPDFVHVVADIALGASYRPMAAPLQAAGIPKPTRRNSWYLDPDTQTYKPLTVAMRTELTSGQDESDPS
ncbi:acyl-CoA synthetase [Mycobacterium sp. 141]|uniref:acyl-CoA synthetase n=1 Tax=Mycobacterium sp. 141 TaxID=1120797 RepID=UPI0009D9E241|nr:acyl-CoA synthetase [Mycobacterium sp. 141]